jgi:hypothetical protein
MDLLVERLLDNYTEWKLLATREHARANDLQQRLDEVEHELHDLRAEPLVRPDMDE